YRDCENVNKTAVFERYLQVHSGGTVKPKPQPVDWRKNLPKGLPRLEINASNAFVRGAQAAPVAWGYLTYAPPKTTIDGWFGKKTLAATKDFQKAHGLVVDGIIGPQTWGELLSCADTVEYGDRGRHVRLVQALLCARGRWLAID